MPWEKLKNKSVLITGASGLIGSFLIDVLMRKNISELNCKIYALGRNVDKAKNRFEKYWTSPCFEFVSHDINDPLELNNVNKIDYVVHLASNTHPVAYATDPIGTVTANIIGTNYLENEKIPDIDDFGKSLVQDFDYDISLLECFLPTAQVITNTSIVIMNDINYDVYLSSENVPYRKFRLNSSSYLENDALSAKLRKLFQTFL